MDKQQQIEEMAQCKNSFGITCNECCTKACDRYSLAEELYNAGYRKIPENAVVLTREEHQKYLAFKIIEPQVRGCLDRERELEKRLQEIAGEFAKEYLAVSEQTRKETAEKFAERVKERIYSHDYLLQDTDDLLVQEIYEICEEIVEGKDYGKSNISNESIGK